MNGEQWMREAGYKLSPIGAKVANLIDDLYGIHNMPSRHQRNKTDWSHDHYIRFSVDQNLATFDGNLLTRLVFLCHDYALRLEIDGACKGYVTLMFHERRHGPGRFFERHPTLEQAVKEHRKDSPLVEEPA